MGIILSAILLASFVAVTIAMLREAILFFKEVFSE